MKTREVQLSDEQLHFIALGKKGKNILVDACIGSGKTTSIQKLCEQLPENSQILYLTYCHMFLWTLFSRRAKFCTLTIQFYSHLSIMLVAKQK